MVASRRSEALSILVLVLVFGTDTLVFVVEHLSTGADGRLVLASTLAVVDQVFLADTAGLLVIEHLGMITGGRGRLATALAVIDEVARAFAFVLVEVKLLGMSALRSADTVLIGLETGIRDGRATQSTRRISFQGHRRSPVFLAFTMTLVVPPLVVIAFRYAFVVKDHESRAAIRSAGSNSVGTAQQERTRGYHRRISSRAGYKSSVLGTAARVEARSTGRPC